MTGLTIYVEGGGDTAEQKALLRTGLDGLFAALKDRAREKRWRWKIVPCGARTLAWEAFNHARRHARDDEVILLLVDAEAPVSGAAGPAEHLRQRPEDGWNLSGVPEHHVHLMVQAMETWIVADPEAMEAYYGHGFRRDALPRRANLEEEPKHDCLSRLAAATRDSRKGEYHKIRHAGELLRRICERKVRQRCLHADRLFAALLRLMA